MSHPMAQFSPTTFPFHEKHNSNTHCILPFSSWPRHTPAVQMGPRHSWNSRKNRGKNFHNKVPQFCKLFSGLTLPPLFLYCFTKRINFSFLIHYHCWMNFVHNDCNFQDKRSTNWNKMLALFKNYFPGQYKNYHEWWLCLTEQFCFPDRMRYLKKLREMDSGLLYYRTWHSAFLSCLFYIPTYSGKDVWRHFAKLEVI